MKIRKRRIRPSLRSERPSVVKTKGLVSRTWDLPADGTKQHSKIMFSRNTLRSCNLKKTNLANKLNELGRNSPAAEAPDTNKF